MKSASTTSATGSRSIRREQVHRGFGTAVIDEADSILIDEARIPLVIAVARSTKPTSQRMADRVVRELLPGPPFPGRRARRNINLTPAGVGVRRARARLRQPVRARRTSPTTRRFRTRSTRTCCFAVTSTYLVVRDAVLPVDEFKGRGVPDGGGRPGCRRRFEAKEGVRRRVQGRVLGSIHGAASGRVLRARVRHDRHRGHAGGRAP
jgi:preprotein translocase subunit SecA